MILQRLLETQCGTIGRLILDNKPLCYSLELPWINNQNNVSCIPPGMYEAEWVYTKGHGWCYHIKDVPNRFGILIHSGNHAGVKPCITHSAGCILPGLTVGILNGQFAVLNSATAVRKIATAMEKKPFRLEIRNV